MLLRHAPQAEAHDLSIPMPGHPMPASALDQIAADVRKVEELILAHDVIFLLTDTRESRWLPSLLAAEHGKLTLTVRLILAFLGNDSTDNLQSACRSRWASTPFW